jgi:hypothetical protein
MFLLHYFSFTRFLLHYFSFTSSFFRGLSLLLRLLNEAKLDKEGIKDLVKANARKYHTKLTIECENSTPQRWTLNNTHQNPSLGLSMIGVRSWNIRTHS